MDTDYCKVVHNWESIETNLDQDAFLASLKVLCRQEENCVRAMDLVPKLCRLAAEARMEALKVLSNICYHLPTARQLISEDCLLVDSLTKNSAKGIGEVSMLSMRLLFFLTLDLKFVEKCRANGDLLAVCYNILDRIDDKEAALYALRVLYNLETSMTEEHGQSIFGLAVDRQLSLKLRGSAINLLLKGGCLNTNAESIFNLFMDIVKAADQEIVHDYLPSLTQLMITKCVGLRGCLRRQILPKDKTTNQQTRHMIIDLFKSPHVELVMAIGDMSMWLLRMNTSRLLYHFGYENVAGYLYMKGIQAQDKPAQLDASSDEEEIRLNGVQGCTTANHNPPSPEMTEEEKLMEADRLIELFERLEKIGVVSVLRQQND